MVPDTARAGGARALRGARRAAPEPGGAAAREPSPLRSRARRRPAGPGLPGEPGRARAGARPTRAPLAAQAPARFCRTRTAARAGPAHGEAVELGGRLARARWPAPRASGAAQPGAQPTWL